ncbi:MAG: response regulator transcription factor [Alphaproteobacteria bacterium]|nr:response regulator transcription factor [Alphaproteobacteria bacterium]
MIRILLADDHALFRKGIRQLLELEDDLEVVGEVGDGAGVLEFVSVHPVDIVLLDLSLPGMSGMETLRRLSEEAPRVQTIILTMYPESNYAQHLIRQGAGAFVTKSESPEVLLAAIHDVAAGRVHMSDALRAISTSKDDRPPHDRLSARESQVFLLLIEGKTVSEVAYALDLQVSTVSTLVSRIREKLGVESVGEVLLYAHRMGLLN